MPDEQTPASTNEKAADDAKSDKSQIPEIIERYAARIRSIRRCAKEYIQLAKNASEQWKQGFVLKVQSHLVQKSDDGQTVRLNIDHLISEELSYHVTTPHSDILSQSLLIFGFSAFDAFVGLLLARLYKEQPNLIFKLEEKEIKVVELLNSKSREELLNNIIDRDISSLLRKSYEEQFGIFATRHGISTLKKFPNWSAFVEAAQRRNLITHCNGVVNSQYLKACESAGYKLPQDLAVGDQLTADEAYVNSVLDLLYEVGIKLGNILWRTTIPAAVERSEKLLTDELFALLKREEWHLARIIGEFAITLPDKSTDLNTKIARINYAQALKWSGDNAGAMRILDAEDWTGSIRDLRLGVEVLRENYDEAAKLMLEIGKIGELVREGGYREWPVFREFRKSTKFSEAFEKVYGKEFAVSETEVTVTLALPRQERDCSTPPPTDTISEPAPSNGDSSMPSYPPNDEPLDSDEGSTLEQ